MPFLISPLTALNDVLQMQAPEPSKTIEAASSATAHRPSSRSLVTGSRRTHHQSTVFGRCALRLSSTAAGYDRPRISSAGLVTCP